MTVTPTKDTPFLPTGEQGILSVKKRDQQGSVRENNHKVAFSADIQSDNLELSKATKDVLEEAERNTHQLLTEYPQYSGVFLGNRKMEPSHSLSQAISFLTRTQSFLSDPYLKELSQQESDFSEFYAQVASLDVENQHALKKIQDELKGAESPTYHSIQKRGSLY